MRKDCQEISKRNCLNLDEVIIKNLRIPAGIYKRKKHETDKKYFKIADAYL